MSSPQEIAAIEAEVNYYRDSVALMRARLYRRGDGTTPRFEELQRRLDSAQRRLAAARAAPAPAPRP
jgi:outer membrane protein TolC